MDANLAAAIITALVALVAVLGTAIFVAIRRNGSGSRDADIGKQMFEALTPREDILREMLVNQERLVSTQHQIVASQEHLADRMIEWMKKLEEGLGELVEIHRAMEVRRKELGRMVDEGGHS